MANRGGHPGRTLIIFGVIIAALYGADGDQQQLDAQAGSGPAGRHDHHPDGQEHHRHRSGRSRPACSLPRRSSRAASTASASASPRSPPPATTRSSSACPTSSRTSSSGSSGRPRVLRFRAVYAAEQVTPPTGRPRRHRPAPTGSGAASGQPSAVSRRRRRRRTQRAARPAAPRRRPGSCRPAPAAAARTPTPDRRTGHGHAAGQGDRLAAERGRPGRLRRVHL